MMGVALGLAMTTGELAEIHFGVSQSAKMVIEAIYCSVFAVAFVLWFRCRIDKLPLRGLGFPGWPKSLYSFGLGLVFTLSSALLLFGTAWAAGWIIIDQITWSTYILFAGKTLFIAFLIEAFPEELTLRGYSYKSLNTGYSRWISAIWTTVVFLLIPGIAYTVHAVTANVLLGTDLSPALSPPGMEPAVYLFLLIFFGTTLIVTRIVTGSLWSSIAIHLSFLLVNRTLLESEQISGWAVTIISEDVLLLIPGYLTLTLLLFLFAAWWKGIRVGWSQKNPEFPVQHT